MVINKKTSEYIIKLYLNNFSLEKISKQTNITPYYLAKHLKENNIPISRKKFLFSKSHQEKICKIYLGSKNVDYIANQFNCSNSTINRVLKKNNIKIRGKRKYLIKENYFEKIDTLDKAYWLGFIMADGSIINDVKKHSYYLKIQLNKKDKNHLIKFGSAIIDNFNKKIVKSIKVKDKRTNKYYYSSYLILSSKKLVNDLCNINAKPRKSLILKYPEGKISKEFLPHFIRGYFDGDGCISKNYGVSLIGSYSFIRVLKKKIEDILNIKCSKLYKTNTPKIRVLDITSDKYKLKFLNWIYKKCEDNIKLDRKYILWLSFKNKIDLKVNLKKLFYNQIKRTISKGHSFKTTANSKLSINVSIQKKILKCLQNNLSYKEICDELNISIYMLKKFLKKCRSV